MEIISHRGYWVESAEKNSRIAFERSFQLGFGIETDLRDFQGEVVISHDMPLTDEIMTLEDLFQLYKSNKQELPLALNIKSDGLQNKISRLVKKYRIENYFLFDMSIPDLLQSLRKNLNCLTRRSEYEGSSPLDERAEGVWLDEFDEQWITESILKDHIGAEKRLFIVSPELHKKEYLQRWEFYKSISPELSDRCILCTDFPEEAHNFFHERQ